MGAEVGTPKKRNSKCSVRCRVWLRTMQAQAAADGKVDGKDGKAKPPGNGQWMLLEPPKPMEELEYKEVILK